MNIKIICGQIDITPGRPDLNYQKILSALESAHAQKADILLLPEMCLSGYFIGDIWEQESFLDDCAYYNQQIINASHNLCVIFGSVAWEKNKYNEDGTIRKYNAAYVCQNGQLLGGYLGRTFLIKNSLPNYHQFDDSRYFYSLEKLCHEENFDLKKALQPVEINIRNKNIKLGILLCEDSWNKYYTNNISDILAKNGAQILFNLSCSPFAIEKNETRKELLSQQAQKLQLPIIYCNNVGIQNNGKNVFAYDGSSMAYDNKGNLQALANPFQEDLMEINWDPNVDALKAPYTYQQNWQPIEYIYQVIKYSTAKFLKQCHIKKMTIGLSGGIDSAVTAALYADILGPENILLLNLPSKYNSNTTRNIAYKLAQSLGANYGIISITPGYNLTISQLENSNIVNFKNKQKIKLDLNSLIKENIQARDRGARIIAAAAAAFGGAFSCNSNKTELSIGYATFYGDIAGAISIIGDLWKHQVYALGHYLNDYVFKHEVIPNEIFNIRPSAELSDKQTVGNGGDPLYYQYHDYLFKAFIENNPKPTPANILEWYIDDKLSDMINCDQEIIPKIFTTPQEFIDDLERWWNLFTGFAVAKRIQAPPIISISPRSFGYDYRESQLTPYFSRRYYELKNKILNK